MIILEAICYIMCFVIIFVIETRSITVDNKAKALNSKIQHEHYYNNTSTNNAEYK
jgi:hypothetical protein